MIHTKFNGYGPDGLRTYNKGGGIITTVVNIVLDVVAPPVGAAMHAVTAVKSAAEGNILGAVGNAFGAYSVGGGFSDGGFGSTFEGAAGEVAGASGALGDAPMAGMWADPEAAAGGWWGGGAGEVSGGVDSSYNWDGASSSFNGSGSDVSGDFGYDAGDTFVAPDASSVSNAVDAVTPSIAPVETPVGPDIFQNVAPDSAYGSSGTSSVSNVNALDPLSQNMSTGLSASPYTNAQSSAYGTPEVTGGMDGLNSVFTPSPEAGTSDFGTTSTTLDSNASLGGTANMPSSSSVSDKLSWSAPGAENINYDTVGGQSTPSMNMSTTAPSLTDKLMSNTAEPSMWDKISGYATDPKNFGTMLKGVGMMQSVGQQQQAAQALQQAAAKQDPFAEQRPQYQAALSQSYVDPMAVYNSPQYQGLNSIFQKQIAARDAAAGRNSQYAARAIEQQNNFMEYLNKYRAGLLQPAGANIAPNASAVQAQIASQNYASNVPRQLGAAYQDLNLGSLFGG